MPHLFGTDGVRGVAGEDLTEDLAAALGRAAGTVLAPSGGAVVVGRDTRVSGPVLERGLVGGLIAAGVDVRLAGIVPTPAVAWLTQDENAAAGAVISASHNPVRDNGIKFFAASGVKTDSAVEDEIEELVDRPPTADRSGSVQDIADGASRYTEHLVQAIRSPLDGLKTALDCAFGAAWAVGPSVFEKAGLQTTSINDEPDGTRINVDCGSTNLARVRTAVLETQADFGFAFDGDADRVLAVDETGAEVDGDRLLAMLALDLLERGELEGNVVVSTVMANLGFRRALEERGIEVVVTPVGDKHVAAAMQARGASLGGEQSGHLILSRYATTGDGILAALKIAEIVASTGQPMSKLAHVFEPFPQRLINVAVRDRRHLAGSDAVWDAVRKAESQLGRNGRVLVRASGTENLVRVMVEAEDDSAADRAATALADTVKKELGA